MEIFSHLSDVIMGLWDFIIHIDVHLDDLTTRYGNLTYVILFLIIFWETGVVVCPFLPGDSLLFAAGAISAREGSPLEPALIFLATASAAFAGDAVNYWVGRFAGPKVFARDGRLLKRRHLDRTRDFYDRYGVSTIVLARFVPVVRTFAPFVAGVGQMSYARFMGFNLVGGLAWSFIFVTAGNLFGALPAVRDNFTTVILAIVVVSALPMIVGAVRTFLTERKS
jgi:membrane-associated protein